MTSATTPSIVLNAMGAVALRVQAVDSSGGRSRRAARDVVGVFDAHCVANVNSNQRVELGGVGRGNADDDDDNADALDNDRSESDHLCDTAAADGAAKVRSIRRSKRSLTRCCWRIAAGARSCVNLASQCIKQCGVVALVVAWCERTAREMRRRRFTGGSQLVHQRTRRCSVLLDRVRVFLFFFGREKNVRPITRSIQSARRPRSV